ncbi:MAG: hypothetical protein A3F09_02750 [Chlamydiae bacterium RIFCSPHIGHO2_12_FULL_49_11]|nr:MAG: hypothetical protein A3F09_02750 [Chlamydiae bacterium RIFCSPHIGHO2_12_FULL_49_11]
MKFTGQRPFFAHVVESMKEGCAKLFTLAVPEDSEALVLETCRKIVKTDLEKVTLTEVGACIEILSSLDLFSTGRVIFFLPSEKMSPEELKAVFSLVNAGPDILFLIVTRTDKVLEHEATSHGSFLDVLRQKPWDKRKEWVAFLTLEFRAAGLNVDEEMSSFLFELYGDDALRVRRELEKLQSAFHGGRKVTILEAEEFLSRPGEFKVSKYAEEVVWKGAPLKEVEGKEVISMIALLRYHYRTLLELSTGEVPAGKSYLISRYKPSFTEERLHKARTMLRFLFEKEIQAKRAPARLLPHFAEEVLIHALYEPQG